MKYLKDRIWLKAISPIVFSENPDVKREVMAIFNECLRSVCVLGTAAVCV